MVTEADLLAERAKHVARVAVHSRKGYPDPEKVEASRRALARIKAQRARINADRALLAAGIDPKTFEAEL